MQSEAKPVTEWTIGDWEVAFQSLELDFCKGLRDVLNTVLKNRMHEPVKETDKVQRDNGFEKPPEETHPFICDACGRRYTDAAGCPPCSTGPNRREPRKIPGVEYEYIDKGYIKYMQPSMIKVHTDDKTSRYISPCPFCGHFTDSTKCPECGEEWRDIKDTPKGI